MSTANAPIRFRKKRLKAFRGRGQLYSWLRAHSEKIAAGLHSGEYTWPILCAECSRHGVVSRDGRPPTRKAAAKAWQTLCRDLETLGPSPRERPEQRRFPSQMPKGWVPPDFAAAAAAGHAAALAPPPTGGAIVSSPPPPSPVPTARPASGGAISRYARPDDPPEVQAVFADVEQQLNKQDRWLLATPSKRRED
jgi:hypothetical protein